MTLGDQPTNQTSKNLSPPFHLIVADKEVQTLGRPRGKKHDHMWGFLTFLERAGLDRGP